MMVVVVVVMLLIFPSFLFFSFCLVSGFFLRKNRIPRNGGVAAHTPYIKDIVSLSVWDSVRLVDCKQSLRSVRSQSFDLSAVGVQSKQMIMCCRLASTELLIDKLTICCCRNFSWNSFPSYHPNSSQAFHLSGNIHACNQHAHMTHAESTKVTSC